MGAFAGEESWCQLKPVIGLTSAARMGSSELSAKCSISQAACLFQNQWVWTRFTGDRLMAFHCGMALLKLTYLGQREVFTDRTRLL